MKVKVNEVIQNDHDLERSWPLLGEKAQGAIKFRAIFTPAAKQKKY